MAAPVCIPTNSALGFPFLYVLIGEVSVEVLCPFLNWIVYLPGVESCVFFIYFGDQTFVQDLTYNEQIYFPIKIDSLFILLMFSLATQKPFNLM